MIHFYIRFFLCTRWSCLLTCPAVCSETDKPSGISRRQMANRCCWDILLDGRADRDVQRALVIGTVSAPPQSQETYQNIHSASKMETLWEA